MEVSLDITDFDFLIREDKSVLIQFRSNIDFDLLSEDDLSSLHYKMNKYIYENYNVDRLIVEIFEEDSNQGRCRKMTKEELEKYFPHIDVHGV